MRSDNTWSSVTDQTHTLTFTSVPKLEWNNNCHGNHGCYHSDRCQGTMNASGFQGSGAGFKPWRTPSDHALHIVHRYNGRTESQVGQINNSLIKTCL